MPHPVVGLRGRVIDWAQKERSTTTQHDPILAPWPPSILDGLCLVASSHLRTAGTVICNCHTGFSLAYTSLSKALLDGEVIQGIRIPLGDVCGKSGILRKTARVSLLDSDSSVVEAMSRSNSRLTEPKGREQNPGAASISRHRGCRCGRPACPRSIHVWSLVAIYWR